MTEAEHFPAAGCPTCGAVGDQPCTTPTGVPLDGQHPARTNNGQGTA